MSNINKLTANRLKFVQLASAKFGDGALITKKQIDAICAENNMPVAQWFYTSDQYKTGQRALYKLPFLADCMPIVGHSLPMNGNVPVNNQMSPYLTPIVQKSDEELLQEIDNIFSTITILAESIKNGTTTSLILSGPAGIGKSHNIEKVLGENDCIYIHGRLKATHLYKTMYEYRQKGQTIIIDDSDELFGDENSLNLLKHGLDSKENRHITWGNDYKLELDGEEIPKSFNYRGSMIFITNLDFYQEINKGSKIGKHLSALISRSHYIDMDMYDTRKLFLHTMNIIKNSNMFEKLGLWADQQEMVCNFIENNVDKLREITPRMAHKLGQLVRLGKNWETIARQSCLKR